MESEQERFDDITRAARVAQIGPLVLAKMGVPQDEMRHAARTLLAPYFTHPDVIESLPPSVAVTALNRVMFLSTEGWMKDAYHECIGVYRRAQSAIGEASIDICRKWSPSIRLGESRIMSRMSRDHSADPSVLDITAQRVFEDIGQDIEANLQPHLREILDQYQMGVRIPPISSSCESKDFGVVVNDLVQSGAIPMRLLMPGTWGVRIHQWRNIARHDDWEIIGDSVHCWYGTSLRQEIVLTEDQLKKVELDIQYSILVLFAARAVFLLDRLVPLVELLFDNPDRRPALQPMTAYSMEAGSNGLEITSFRLSRRLASVTARDVTDKDPATRRWTVAAMVYKLWEATQRDNLEVTYCEKDGTPNLRATARGGDCQLASADWGQMLKRLSLFDLKSGRIIQKNQHPTSVGDKPSA